MMRKSMSASCPHRRQASSHTGSHFIARLLIANRKIRHMLQPLDQRRMVPITATEGGAGAEHLLGAGGVRQVDPQLLGPGQRQVQILLVQIDAKAWIECALDHTFAVHFKDLRRGEAAHQRFTHLGRVGAVFRGEQQRFSHRLDVQCDDDLVRHFGGLAVAVAAEDRKSVV